MQIILAGIKYLILGFLGLAGIVVVSGGIFLGVNPQFGGDPTEEQLAEYERLDYYEEGAFENLISTSMDMDFSKIVKMFKMQW